jgi:hypothetical protein
MIIDPRTGQEIDPAQAGAYLQRSIINAKSMALDDMVSKGQLKISNASAIKRNSVGDALKPMRGADSGGNFATYFTEVFDPLINKPLWHSEYSQNIAVEQVPFGTEATSFVNSQVFGATTKDKQGIAWAASQETALPRVSAEFAKTLVNVAGWGRQASFDVFEIARAQMNGIALEMTVLENIGIQWEIDSNIVAHLGSYAYGGYGLLNQAGVTPLTAATKAAGGKRWVIAGVLNATPAEILSDIRALENSAWAASGFNIVATDLLLDPVSFAALTAPLSVAGTNGGTSILEYISKNSVCNAKNGEPLKIRANRFLLGSTAGTENSIVITFNATGADQGSAGANTRAVLYTNARQYVRMKATNPFALQIQYSGLNYNIPYVGQLPAGVEYVYSNTVAYMDQV